MTHVHYSEDQRQKLEDLGCSFRISLTPARTDNQFECQIVHTLTEKVLCESYGESAKIAFDTAVGKLDASMLPLTGAQTQEKAERLEAENAALKRRIDEMREAAKDAAAAQTEAPPATHDDDDADVPPKRGRGKSN